MTIDYNHTANTHSTSGAQAALSVLLGNHRPASMLDVGCGIGTWLWAAQRLGIADVFGVDGVDVPDVSLLVSKRLFARHDLLKPLRLGRRFEMVLCLEVAEHLEPEASEVLIASLTEHAETIFFSAASPGQPGQHHINCQWPSYWQTIFNARGFACDDAARWRVWTDHRIEHWYRQNLFCARKDESYAGSEPRIAPVIHPDFLPGYPETEAFANALSQIAAGCMPAKWYLGTTYSVVSSKLRRNLR